MAERTELRTWSFLALLVGGILILVGGLMGSLMMGASGWMGMMPMSVYMDDPWISTMAWWMGLVGAIAGGLVLFAASEVRRDRNARAWGAVAIVAGALSLFAMGGFMVGAIAAITGGALALVDEQEKPSLGGGA